MEEFDVEYLTLRTCGVASPVKRRNVWVALALALYPSSEPWNLVTHVPANSISVYYNIGVL
jgi:hypothetical protein